MIKKSLGIALLASTLVVMGCSSDDESTPAATDTGTTDTGTTDTGTTDTGTTDTGTTDTGTTDTGTTDTGTTDTGTTDTGTTDTGTTDTGTTDTGTTDTGTTDTGTTDTGTTDTGTTDTGSTDSGSTGESGYPAGSLADVAFNAGATSAMDALKAAGLDLALNDDKNTWTVFLPTNEALANFTGEVSLLTHIYDVAPVTSEQATGLSGNSINMNDGTSVAITGGDTENPLAIGGHAVSTADLVGNTGTSIVHIIDGVLTP